MGQTKTMKKQTALARDMAKLAELPQTGNHHTYECGCVVGVTATLGAGTPWVAYCPLHAAAPKLLEALVALLKLTEAYEEQIDGEWRSCRAIKQIEDNGDLPDEIDQARVAIAEAEPK